MRGQRQEWVDPRHWTLTGAAISPLPQIAARQSNNNPVSMGSRRSMIKDMLSEIPAGLAVHERQAEMCIDRHLVSRAVGIALASAHPAV